MSLGVVVRETGSDAFGQLVRLVCDCGRPGADTGAWPASKEHVAERAMREHLADEHAEFGRCSECNTPTDWLRAHSPEHGDAWLCELHAPAQNLRQMITAPESIVSVR